MTPIATLLTLCTLLAGPTASVSPGLVTAEERTAAAAITPALLDAHIRFLASDLLEGRGSASRGERIAMEYVATQLQSMGFQPSAPGGDWIQRVPLVAITSRVPRTMTFDSGAKRLDIESHRDFIAFSGVQEPAARIDDAELVFVGYGIVAPEHRWDDYKDVDVRGKVLVMMNNDPEEDPRLFGGKMRLRYGRWDYKYEIAAARGAVGAILIHTTPSAGYPWQVVQTSWSGERFELPYEGEPRVRIKIWATEEASRRIAALGGQDLDRLRAAAQRRDFRPVPLPVRLSFALENEVERKESGNVIGRLPGSDPALKEQAVIYTAHHDHLGIQEGAGSGADTICNGAVDNASGVAALLAIAQAYARLPKAPRRTILFASLAAEEQGLLGSEYLARHPPVPPGRIAANVNIDGLNIFGRTRDLTLIGAGKSTLDALVVALAKMQGRVVKPDQFPDRGFFYRSDQFNLSKIGVPAAYFDNGTDVIGKPPGWGREQIEKWEATHYHQPSDQWREDWDLSGAAEDVQLDFYLGLKVADADAMPQWKPGDEFEAARQRALGEAGSP
ncbi:MAG: M28 family peptidase [Thermoanaerobaculia bacterium]